MLNQQHDKARVCLPGNSQARSLLNLQELDEKERNLIIREAEIQRRELAAAMASPGLAVQALQSPFYVVFTGIESLILQGTAACPS